METRIAAILSDYDGTLCPTDSVRSKADRIPKELEQILWDISQKIPVCIISSKDYHFLHPKTKFARILSCIMGIETISLKIHKKVSEETEGGKVGSSRNNIKRECSNISYCIEECHLFPNSRKILQTNSSFLSRLAEDIGLEFKHNVVVERKYTADRQFLAGITVDYRHLKDWRSYKNKLEPSLKEMIRKRQSSSSEEMPDLRLMTYSFHPFLDVYALYSDKGIAFDLVSSQILNIRREGGEGGSVEGILYLGDSENDNPAFERADISIGVRSDKRLKPKLNCKYSISFNRLVIFLQQLLDNHFVFSEDLFC
jgi:hydroxymethylpyrimidine pyrophosphatase-like HAD family hydrolase